MEYFIIAVAALLTSGLTLFSGFGLGTLLMPAFALFFPVDIAIAMTAVVHLLNNLFKLTLVGKHADRGIVLRFGLPAIITSFLGARALLWFAGLQPVAQWHWAGRTFTIMPVNLVVALFLLTFATLELTGRLKQARIDPRWLPFGGLLTGFVGGISGLQGALRSAFLLKCGLRTEAYIATGVVIACSIDIARIFVYSSRFSAAMTSDNPTLLLTAVLAAFSGAFIGSRLMKKVTMRGVRLLVTIMLFAIALALGTGML